MNFIEFAQRTINALNNSGVNYVIVGGILVSYYGEPRVTRDIDVVIDVKPEEDDKISQLVKSFEENELCVIGGKNRIKEALFEKSHFTIFNKSYLYWVDAKGVYDILDKLAIETKVKGKLFGKEAWIEAPEVLVISKLSLYYSERGIEDAKSIIRVSWDKLNKKRLKALAEKFGVLFRLRKILQELDLEL